MPAIRRSLVLCVVAFGVVLSLPAAAQQQANFTTIQTGGQAPTFVAANPVTNTIYVTNFNTNNLTMIDGYNNIPQLVNVDNGPAGIGINPVTNKIYVAGQNANLVTVVDGATLSTISVSAGRSPERIAVNQVTNLIYVANNGSNNVTVIDGSDNTVVATVAVGGNPCAMALNQATNKVYVANCGSGTVTVIDGKYNNNSHTVTITAGTTPNAVAVNTVTDKIYVTNYNSQFITVIDGATNSTSPITTGNNPTAVAVNSVLNQIWVVNYGSSNVTVIDGATNEPITNVGVGSQPDSVAVDAVTNYIYVTDSDYYSSDISIITLVGSTYERVQVVSIPYTAPVSVAVNPVANTIYTADYYGNSFTAVSYANSNVPLQFVPVTPCRLVDTRTSGGPIQGGSFRDFVVPQLGGCNIPSTAAGYSLNVTVVPSGPLGYLTIWPTGEDQPIVSTMNSLDGRIKANAAILQAGYQGAVRVYASNTTNVVLDINGYFAVPGASTLQFYPLPPCRLVDTRLSNGSLGGPFLQGNLERDFPLLESTSCIPQGINPVAYSLNFTAVPHPSGSPLGYLTVWPVGSSKPVVSTLNNPTGTIVANAALVPAGTNGAVAVYPNANTDLLIDIDGYFAAPGSGGLSLYPIAPCRVIDTRKGNGAFRGALNPPVNVTSSPCAPPSTAQAFVFNATVIPSGSLSYLTLWPDGEMQPVVSTLNAVDGAITSNMAIVPTNNGSIDAYAAGLTQLVLDISSYFAP